MLDETAPISAASLAAKLVEKAYEIAAPSVPSTETFTQPLGYHPK